MSVAVQQVRSDCTVGASEHDEKAESDRKVRQWLEDKTGGSDHASNPSSTGVVSSVSDPCSTSNDARSGSQTAAGMLAAAGGESSYAAAAAQSTLVAMRPTSAASHTGILANKSSPVSPRQLPLNGSPKPFKPPASLPELVDADEQLLPAAAGPSLSTNRASASSMAAMLKSSRSEDEQELPPIVRGEQAGGTSPRQTTSSPAPEALDKLPGNERAIMTNLISMGAFDEHPNDSDDSDNLDKLPENERAIMANLISMGAFDDHPKDSDNCHSDHDEHSENSSSEVTADEDAGLRLATGTVSMRNPKGTKADLADQRWLIPGWIGADFDYTKVRAGLPILDIRSGALGSVKFTRAPHAQGMHRRNKTVRHVPLKWQPEGKAIYVPTAEGGGLSGLASSASMDSMASFVRQVDKEEECDQDPNAVPETLYERRLLSFRRRRATAAAVVAAVHCRRFLICSCAYVYWLGAGTSHLQDQITSKLTFLSLA